MAHVFRPGRLGITWASAKDDAATFGGHLATITSAPESQFELGEQRPNDTGGEDTVVLDVGGTWNDNSRFAGLKGYVVEIE